MGARNCPRGAIYRNLLIVLRLLNTDGSIRYSAAVHTTPWGEAIARLLAERGWTKKQLAEAAKVRPNTLTNIITHGRDSDTATLSRIAAALQVNLGELFISKEERIVLRAHREGRVDRLKAAVLKELDEAVTKAVRRELERSGEEPSAPIPPRSPGRGGRPARKRRSR